MLERPHVVQAVAQFDDDDPRVFGNGQQQLAVVLNLLFGRGVEGQAGDLGQAIDDARHLGTKLPGNVLRADSGILHHIVQQRSSDGGAVQELLGQYQRDGNGVGDKVLTRHSLLTAVRGRAEAEGAVDQLQIEPVGVPFEHRPQVRREIRQRTSHSSPAVAKLTNRSPAIMT